MALLAVTMIGWGLSACAPDDPAQQSSQDGTEIDVSAKPAEDPADENGNAVPSEPIAYTDPSEGKSTCDVFDALEIFSEEAAAQPEEASLLQVGERLRILERTALALSGFAADEAAQAQWDTMAEDSGAAANFFESTGQQIVNDDFIALIAKAYYSSSLAYEAQMDAVLTECGVDLAPFLVGPRE
ncbi:hypothetical protein FM113_11425 [Leucobacter sp. 7(1)]|nr:hypothetical protein FM113_11425 [Leucobacter sp. 7(1)]